jgi:hypothetical protein
MAYTINKTNGTILATIADGTINSATSLTLVGKNYAGYGEFLDENFVRLLENGANGTAPGAPLTGQLWYDTSANLLKVYNGTTFKTISAATSSSSAPSSNVTGDIWWDTANQQLKVYNGTSFTLIGPAFTAGTGTSGAIVDTVTDTLAVQHVVVKLFVEDDIVGIVSKDTAFTPSPSIAGFTQIKPGITLASAIGGVDQYFQGTATDAALLDSLDSSQFLRSDANDTTTGTLGILNNSGLTVGSNSDLSFTVSSNDATIRNVTSNGNLQLNVNKAGSNTNILKIVGSTGNILPGANNTIALGSATSMFNAVYATSFEGTSTSAKYADLAERFESDAEYPAGTVVELGGEKEITEAKSDLSDIVFGVISTRAAYLMNSQAGNNETHPPVAMSGRVPVRVVGRVNKGDRLVSAGNGLARAALRGEYTSFNVIGRALVSKTTEDEGMIEAIVTIN